MKMKKFLLISVLIVLAIIATRFSLYYETIHNDIQEGDCMTEFKRSGHVSEACYISEIRGGFPFTFVEDSQGVSVVGSIDHSLLGAFLEDELSWSWFFVDTLFYFVIFGGIFMVVQKLYYERKKNLKI